MKYPREGTSDISFVICGEAGQGIKTVEEILVKVVKRSGYNVFSIKEYMSRIRGGSNSTSIRIGPERIRAPVKRMDIFFPMSSDAIEHLRWRMDEGTSIIFDPGLLGSGEEPKDANIVKTDIKKRSSDLGGKIYINIIIAGLVSGLVGVERSEFEKILLEKFSKKGMEAVEKNRLAMEAGYDLADEMMGDGSLNVDLESDPGTADEMVLKGVNSISLGAIAGGVDLISSYPMSPSTGVLVDLASRQERYDIIAEQAEDEIAAINMALGGWYAGGRAMVTTSGGGFALMTEGMSLAGMMELPLVVHIAQRPGPATGLPTRTEQGDLNIAVFAGHGDFPRVVYAPADIEQGFDVTRTAFEVADRFQVPAVILTDQYLVDSNYNVKDLAIPDEAPDRHITKTSRDYRRYVITEDGISPRGIPGHGKGIVKMDSDEHDEEGHITESMEIRNRMVHKRMRKLENLKEELIEPTVLGDGKGTILLCWGSTFHAVKEAARELEIDDITVVHLEQVYPLGSDLKELLSRAKDIISIENNVTGQLASLIAMELGIVIPKRILKYDGQPFFVEELVERIDSILNQKGGGA